MNRLVRIVRFAIRPRFFNAEAKADPYARFTSYTRQWGISMVLLAAVALVPLAVMATIDYKLTRDSLEQQLASRLDRATSNLRRSIFYFLEERASALKFLLEDQSYSQLSDSEHLQVVLKNLKVGFGGMVDLGLINAVGRQVAYAGPFELEGKDYSEQEWFADMPESGVFISDVFLGYRNEPHMFIAVRFEERDRQFILRATLDTGRLTRILDGLDIESEAFLINDQGVVQTPGREHGIVLEPTAVPVPAYSERTQLFRWEDKQGREYQVGYAYIQGSPFILLVLKPMRVVMSTWADLRRDLSGFLVASVLAIVGVIYLISTYMINKAYDADRQQAKALQHMEDTNRLASIGRLAAGVAHEINNPLAIIEMKAGLIKDLLSMCGEDCQDERLMGHIDSVLQSVDRCGLITKQLLGFAREVELNIQRLKLKSVVDEVLGFLEKEASYRNIQVEVAIPDDLPPIRSDRGKLQQVILNIVNNAFQAMSQGGRLAITATAHDGKDVELVIADTGPGISPENMKKIFEPFFTTKRTTGGSGLGLSITYGLVKKLGGSIDVESEEGKGTTFTITLPLATQSGEEHENSVG